MNQFITRKGTFDAGHRVMNERMKCFHLHGHTYHYELTFSFTSMEEIGYPIDFKEIKRIGCAWIDEFLDHGMILNPQDTEVINLCESLKTKTWIMSLNGDNYCNPTVENIARELLCAMRPLFCDEYHINPYKIVLYETPNCFTECFDNRISEVERNNFYDKRWDSIFEWAESKGKIEYDDRKA